VRGARLRAAGTASLIVALTGLAAHQAAGRGSATTTVRVTEKEFTIKAVPASVKPGKVNFVVKNAGKIDHEFVVVKTNRAPGKLPVKNNRASEVGRVGRTPPFERGATQQITLPLKAGKYVLFCNVTGHYKLGQRTGFRVG
jgi:uncharacterized cupredoxin-like copper-binding protein